jgi:hypothetical protein
MQEHGYDALFQAIKDLVSDTRMVEHTLGFLFSLALHNFSISGIFDALRGSDLAQVDTRMSDIGPRLGQIYQPGAIQVLWDVMPHLPADESALRYAVYKLFEQLLYLNHRNHVVFSGLGLVKPLFDIFVNRMTMDDKERHVLQKLLRRMLDLGATPADARPIFQKVVKEDDTLDTNVLEIIRSGMKARWPEHFSMESPAALTLTEEGVRGMPSTGFTYMARNSIGNFFHHQTNNIFTLPCRRGYGLKICLRAPLTTCSRSVWQHELF